MRWPNKNRRGVKFRVQFGRTRDVRISIQRVHPRMPRRPRRGSRAPDQHVGVVGAAGNGAAAVADASAGSCIRMHMDLIKHDALAPKTCTHKLTHHPTHTNSPTTSHTKPP